MDSFMAVIYYEVQFVENLRRRNEALTGYFDKKTTAAGIPCTNNCIPNLHLGLYSSSFFS